MKTRYEIVYKIVLLYSYITSEKQLPCHFQKVVYKEKK
jgi:hypothetical protein